MSFVPSEVLQLLEFMKGHVVASGSLVQRVAATTVAGVRDPQPLSQISPGSTDWPLGEEQRGS